MFEGIASLVSGYSTKDSAAIVKQVVDASIAGACEKVAAKVHFMSLSEARGYIRARAAEVVRRESRIALSRASNSGAYCLKAVVRTATERLIPIVLKKMSVGVPTARELPLAA